MTTIEQIIENFKGTTFSSHEDVEKWIRQALEQVREETIAECEKAVADEIKETEYEYEAKTTVGLLQLDGTVKETLKKGHKYKSNTVLDDYDYGFNACRSETLANIQALRKLDKL